MIIEPHSFHSAATSLQSPQKYRSRSLRGGGRLNLMSESEIHATLVNRPDRTEGVLSEIAIFGRKQESTICLPDNRVSRRHAMIRRQEEGQYWFYDLGSFNGSYVNGERVTTVRQLEDGDLIRICDFEYQFDLVRPGDEAEE